MHIGDSDVLIVMSGDVDYLVTADFDMVRALDPARGRPVRFDLGAVTFFDSRGIAELLTARNFAPRVELVNTPPDVRTLLELTGVLSLFDHRS